MAAPSRTSILIVDDNDVSRAMLRHILIEQGYKVVGTAASGQLGLELAARLQPQIVCLDIMLPDCNGLDVLKRVREQWPQTTVLMVTGDNDRTSVSTAMQHGAAGYIVKPFNPATLLQTIAQVAFKTV